MFRRVVWAMFALAAGALTAFALMEEEGMKSQASGAFGVALGLAMIAMASAGIEEGSIRGRRRHVDRAGQPVTFWGIITIYAVAGVVLFAGALYHLLG